MCTLVSWAAWQTTLCLDIIYSMYALSCILINAILKNPLKIWLTCSSTWHTKIKSIQCLTLYSSSLKVFVYSKIANLCVSILYYITAIINHPIRWNIASLQKKIHCQFLVILSGSNSSHVHIIHMYVAHQCPCLFMFSYIHRQASTYTHVPTKFFSKEDDWLQGRCKSLTKS